MYMFFFLIALLLFPTAAFGQTVFFKADAENGTVKPPWDDLNTVTNNTTVAKNGARSFKFSTIDASSDNDSKVIVYSSGRAFHVSAYYSAWYYIAAGYNDTKWRNNMQWKTADGTSTVQPEIKGRVKTLIGFETINGVRQVILNVPDCNLANCKPRQPSPIPVPTAKWFHLEVYYKASKTNGHIAIWQDGVQIFNFTTPNLDTLRTKDKAGSGQLSTNEFLYWGIGSYIDPKTTGEQTVYADDAMITDYRVSASTNNPPPTANAPIAPSNLTIVVK